MRVLRRKRNVVVLTVLVVMLAAGAAFGFYILHGNGSGSSTSTALPAPTSVPLTVSGQADAAGLIPVCNGCGGGSAHPGDLDFHVLAVATNVADQSKSVTVNNAVPGAITVDSGHPGCSPNWFVPYDYTPGVGYSNLGVIVTGSTPTDVLGGFNVTFTDNGGDQSACIGATVSLAVSVS